MRFQLEHVRAFGFSTADFEEEPKLERKKERTRGYNDMIYLNPATERTAGVPSDDGKRICGMRTKVLSVCIVKKDVAARNRVNSPHETKTFLPVPPE